MHLRKYVRQIRPIQENYIKPEDKIQFLFTEEVNLPTEVFGGLPFEKSERQSSAKRDVIIPITKYLFEVFIVHRQEFHKFKLIDLSSNIFKYWYIQ